MTIKRDATLDKRTALVTGAAGFIGFHLCNALLERGEYPGQRNVCGGGIEEVDWEGIGLPDDLIQFFGVHHRVIHHLMVTMESLQVHSLHKLESLRVQLCVG